MAYSPPEFKNEITLPLSRNESVCAIDDLPTQLGGLSTEFVTRYPAHAELQALIGQWIGVDPERIVVTAGGDDSIDRVMRKSITSDRKKIVSHVPSFEMIDIYAGNYGGELVCVDLAKGKIAWRYDTGRPVLSSPAIGPRQVVFGARDNYVYSLSRKDGRELWKFRTGDSVDSSPVIVGSKVVVGSDDGRLYLLRLADGKMVWSYETGQSITSSPAVADGMVVVGCDDGTVYCFK